jgi:hypothetical protein
MNLMESAFAADPTLKEEMLGTPWRPWKGTLMEGYRQLDAKQKGAVGERIADAMMAQLGHDIAPRTNPGHDSAVDGIKVEYKFSAASKCAKRNALRQDKAMMNHVSAGKDWERLVFLVINISEDSLEQVHPSQIVPQLWWFTKEDFERSIATGTGGRDNPFSRQQAGEDGGNDDYISELNRLKKHGILRPITEW